MVGLLLQADVLLTAPAGRRDCSPGKISDDPEVTQPVPGEEPSTWLLHVSQAPPRSSSLLSELVSEQMPAVNLLSRQGSVQALHPPRRPSLSLSPWAGSKQPVDMFSWGFTERSLCGRHCARGSHTISCIPQSRLIT